MKRNTLAHNKKKNVNMKRGVFNVSFDERKKTLQMKYAMTRESGPNE